ncbi:bifunctional methylenetetrahydrofolate dehydrogenase/methenyltetrahydrofolate cyclohydrolase [Candidatus Bathyarchaeota archaeon]|nr:bifunctional methylenetetrahydrofolate dehydrogenase/methenyltetrahydrofolate cyclohydrolase [Candidatus Bathyarchaeota archaeon]MBS7631583.1 bifunctional methylenetetrahydrofolate dehydrogenase/methenyltetrahydrofolate cyclohydrolase [Candidatus Bathyarchaeota archaeon]
MAVILDGRAVASKIVEELKAKTQELKMKGITPTLALVLVGDDVYSKRYVDMKIKRCEEVGVKAILNHISQAGEKELLELLKGLNEDPHIHGVMIQLPLPEGFDESKMVERISPEKDVDGLSPSTLGRILLGEEAYLPAGVEAIMELLSRYRVEWVRKHWVILGLSNITGKPLTALLLNRKVTVTTCHPDQKDLSRITRDADVLVVDVARKWFITANMVKRNSVVIDNGNNYEEKKVYGDVDFENVKEIASAITPVPGGVGPLLVTMLVRNTVKAAEKISV